MSPVSLDVIAFLGGLLPALLWLSFWLLEDRCQPEPKWRLFLTFFAGMAFVFLALPIEQAVVPYLRGGVLLLLGWAIVEEMLKFGAAYGIGIRSRAYDEPVDAFVYLVTAALGFSAAENALFLLEPLQSGTLAQTIAIGDLRFIGATLLHTLSSAIVGVSVGFAFYRPRAIRRAAAAAGVILAVSLHTFFNFLILKGGGAMTTTAFIAIWVGIAAVLVALERVKRVHA